MAEDRPLIQPSPKTAQIMKEKGYTIGNQINYGSFASVREGTFKGKPCAVKVIDLTKATKDFRNKFLPREIEAVQKLQHPNIIKVYDVISEKDRVTYIFMEKAGKGDLLDIFKKDGKIKEDRAKLWSHQICSALKYMHDKLFSHRDLKCENVLITDDDRAILTDFGFARWFYDKNQNNNLSTTFCGSKPYVAPEIFKGKPYDPIIADCWSVGVIIYVMLNSTMPFDEESGREFFKAQQNKQFKFLNTQLSPEVRDLISKLLEPDTAKRLTITQALDHPWFKGIPKQPRPQTQMPTMKPKVAPESKPPSAVASPSPSPPKAKEPKPEPVPIVGPSLRSYKNTSPSSPKRP